MELCVLKVLWLSQYLNIPEQTSQVMQAAEILAKNTVEQMRSGKQNRYPFQELPVLPEDYGNDDDEEDGGGGSDAENPQKLPDESQMLDMDEGDDGEYLPEQMQDGKYQKIRSK